MTESAEQVQRGPDPGLFDDGPPKRGISDLVAVALIALDLDTVRRATIRSLLPEKAVHHQTGRPTRGPVRVAANRALHRFENHGWARREGPFVHVIDRDGLRSWVDQGADLTDERAAVLLEVQAAADQINARLEDGTAVSGWDADLIRRCEEVRRLELIAIQRLMQAAHTRRTGARIVPAGRVM